jgi:hypothetical protein
MFIAIVALWTTALRRSAMFKKIRLGFAPQTYMTLLQSAAFQVTLAINIPLLRSEGNEFCKGL